MKFLKVSAMESDGEPQMTNGYYWQMDIIDFIINVL